MINDTRRQETIDAARAVREHAYAPYSEYTVGAAILTRSGEIFGGVNVENASYGVTICAERSALASAVSSGAREFVGIALATKNGAPPCGVCRQALAEFAPALVVWLVDEAGQVRETTLGALFPDGFGL